MSALQIAPHDSHNQQLVENVHPPAWQNPQPQGRYHLVVIGAGSAGLITALVAAGLGAKVALVERHLMGGDCLNVGCVPSKAVISAAHNVFAARQGAALGVPREFTPNFGAAMQRMRAIRARISHEDSAARYRDEFGVEVFLGDARFANSNTISVEGEHGNAQLQFAKAVIATGGRAVAPPIPGLAEAGYLDNESVFTLTELPRRLAVIGAGPIGCELAQSFGRLGAEVTVLQRAPRLLPREDPEAAQIVQRRFADEGIKMAFACKLQRAELNGAEKLLHFTIGEGNLEQSAAFDEILVGAGRAPNVEGLGLDKVEVNYDARRGIHVDDHLRTTNPNIYAAGDCCMAWKFTHAADAAAKLVVQNALFAIGPFGKKRLSKLVMPWCTYTQPEIAHVGLYPQEAAAKGIELASYRVDISAANRAVTDGEEEGFVKVHTKKGGDAIVGATIVAAHAGDLITQFTLAITQGIGLGAFTNVIYPYPTQGEALKRAAGLYTRTRLTPAAQKLLKLILKFNS